MELGSRLNKKKKKKKKKKTATKKNQTQKTTTIYSACSVSLQTFMQNYVEIGPVISDKKTFSFGCQPESCKESKSLNNIQVSPKDHSCEIWLKLAQWVSMRCHLQN